MEGGKKGLGEEGLNGYRIKIVGCLNSFYRIEINFATLILG